MSIQYLNKDFTQLKQALVNYIKNNYQNYTDFGPSSPGNMFSDLAAYVGDVLSFYTDTQVQETLLLEAKERKNILPIAYSLGYSPKMICTVRDMPSVLASFVTLANKNPDDNFIDNQLKQTGFAVNNTNRCRLLWRSGTVGEGWEAFRSGFNYYRDKMLILEYEEIVSDPLGVMNQIEEYLGLDHHKYDVDNLKTMEEKDELHGLKGLHDIRPSIKKTSRPPEEIIGHELTQLYNEMKLDFWHNQ